MSDNKPTKPSLHDVVMGTPAGQAAAQKALDASMAAQREMTDTTSELRTAIHMKMLSKSDSAKNLKELTVVPLGFAVSIALEMIAAQKQQWETEARIDELNMMVCNRHYGEGYAEFFTELVNERMKELEAGSGAE